MKELFLDANAHIPVNKSGIESFLNFEQRNISRGHPSGISKISRESSNLIEQSRGQIAKLIGAEANQIIFTHSCTQACQWGMEIFTNKVKNYSVSKFEHPAIQDIIDRKNQQNSTSIPTIELNSAGEMIKPDTNGVICVLMQNEIGSIQLVKELKTQYLFSDMSQAVGKIPVNVKELEVDVGALGCHKWAGFGGVGVLFLRDPNWWQGFGTGSRYYTDIPGTPFTGGIIASAAALQETIDTLPQRTKKMLEFQTILENRMEIMGLEIVGKNLKRSPNTTFITGFDGMAAFLLLKLSEVGIYVALGSACGSVNVGENRTLKALGKKAGIHDNLRISTFGEYGKEEANYVADMIKDLWVKN